MAATIDTFKVARSAAPWSPEHLAELRETVDRRGMSRPIARELALRFGRTVEAVECRAERLPLNEAAPTFERKCLTCRQPFQCTDRRRHWMCAPCGQSDTTPWDI